MRRLPAVIAALFAPVAFAATTASAVAPSASGDTCTASGSGTAYTLHITVPAGSPQYGFAFGAAGAKVTGAVIPGMNGSFSSENLAPNTSGAWISDSPVTGSPVATLTLSGQATGSLADRSRKRHGTHLPEPRDVQACEPPLRQATPCSRSRTPPRTAGPLTGGTSSSRSRGPARSAPRNRSRRSPAPPRAGRPPSRTFR